MITDMIMRLTNLFFILGFENFSNSPSLCASVSAKIGVGLKKTVLSANVIGSFLYLFKNVASTGMRNRAKHKDVVDTRTPSFHSRLRIIMLSRVANLKYNMIFSPCNCSQRLENVDILK